MELKQIDPATVSQMKFSIAGDMTANVAMVMTDGRLEVLTGISLPEAKAFQDAVDSAPKTASETIHQPPLDPHENEPGPPVYQTICDMCGQTHPTTGNITCVCQFCRQVKELVHSGTCAKCLRDRFGGYFEQLGTPLEDAESQKPPWAN